MPEKISCSQPVLRPSAKSILEIATFEELEAWTQTCRPALIIVDAAGVDDWRILVVALLIVFH